MEIQADEHFLAGIKQVLASIGQVCGPGCRAG
jgi:hypothetical protein